MHSSFFIHVGEDGSFVQTKEKGKSRKQLQQQKMASTRYSSLLYQGESRMRETMHDSGNFSQLSLHKEPSKKQVNVNPLLVSSNRKTMSKTMLKVKNIVKKQDLAKILRNQSQSSIDGNSVLYNS